MRRYHGSVFPRTYADFLRNTRRPRVVIVVAFTRRSDLVNVSGFRNRFRGHLLSFPLSCTDLQRFRFGHRALFSDVRWRWTSWLSNNFVQVTLVSFHELFG